MLGDRWLESYILSTWLAPPRGVGLWAARKSYMQGTVSHWPGWTLSGTWAVDSLWYADVAGEFRCRRPGWICKFTPSRKGL